MMDPKIQLAVWANLVTREALDHIDIQLSPFEPIGQSHIDYKRSHNA